MTKNELTKTLEQFSKFLESETTDPVTLYLDSLAPSGKRSIRSLLQTVADIMIFNGELEQMPWPLIQYQHLSKVRSTLLEQGKSANTVNLTLSAIRGVMRACFNLRLIKADQLMAINEIKRVRGKRLPSGRSLSKKESKALINTCKDDDSIEGKRDLAIIVLMLSSGLRRSEITALDINDFNIKTGQLIVQSGKGNKQRELFLQSESILLIEPWIDCRGFHPGRLFNPVKSSGEIIFSKMNSQTIYDLLHRRSKQANIEKCSPHDLRRTFVTRLLQSGIDINTVRQLAGHTDIQTTAKYDLRGIEEQKRALKHITFIE